MSSKRQANARAPTETREDSAPATISPEYSSNSDMIAWLGLGLTGCSSPQQGATDDPLAFAVQQLYPSLSAELQDTVDADRLGDLARGVFQEEKERQDWADWAEIGDTLGPGQLGEPAFLDVTKAYPDAWKAFREHYAIPDDVTWSDAVKDARSADFMTVAYLIIQANKSVKPQRSDEDALKFGVGRYHGGYAQIKEAQDKGENTTDFDPLRPDLNDDFENYVDDATSYRTK